jgi:alpha-L-fucosidase
MTRAVITALLFVLLASTCGVAQEYQPNWESLDRRPLPEWFNEAKFGIFVVWGPYSVPAWKDRGYAEWYGNHMNREGSATWKFHRQVYGEDFRYEDFAPLFKAELWDPDFWCDLFAKSGARYVVTTANYHDGFAMYPTQYAAFNDTDEWNSVQRGPKRDIIGELNEAGEQRGLKMGIYYSLYEWYHPLEEQGNAAALCHRASPSQIQGGGDKVQAMVHLPGRRVGGGLQVLAE